MRVYVLLFILLGSAPIAISQKNQKEQGQYSINIFVRNQDTGTIEIDGWSEPKILQLKKGRASFRAQIDYPREGLLLSSRNIKTLDDSTIIRFIAEPSNMSITYSLEKGIPVHIQMTGSASQFEKERWDRGEVAPLKRHRQELNNAYRSLMRNRKTMDSIVVAQQREILFAQMDSVDNLIVKNVLQYVTKNPDSFVSAYLLNWYHKKMPVDTVREYYTRFSNRVQHCQFSKRLFDYLFSLADQEGKMKLIANRSDQSYKVYNAKNLFDFTLPDLSDQPVKLSRYQGKPTLLFFWATWCTPCHRIAPELRSVMEQFKNEPINFVSVSIDTDLDAFKKSKKKISLPCDTYIDTENKLRYFYRFLYVAHLILLDGNGNIIVDDPGVEELPKLISDALNK